ncbi:hypothetical protein [Denitratimonas tolerans]|uniref:Uncharacterized protein n=1 Tax=Denitratimonas tolerans TaxID=1338420 RepID=A0AAW9R8E7_9GAMM
MSSFLKDDQRAAIGLPQGESIRYAITPGSEYVVLGLSVKPQGSRNGSGLFVEIANDWGQCRGISISLFEVIDARCSKYWHVRSHENGTVLLWPEEFYEEYFLDDLIEGDARARQIFADLVSRMDTEVQEEP